MIVTSKTLRSLLPRRECRPRLCCWSLKSSEMASAPSAGAVVIRNVKRATTKKEDASGMLVQYIVFRVVFLISSLRGG
jgi:hypothetical protein